MELPTWMIVAFSLLLGMRLGRWAEREKIEKERQLEKDRACPHGYDWDDCPDCCH